MIRRRRREPPSDGGREARDRADEQLLRTIVQGLHVDEVTIRARMLARRVERDLHRVITSG